MPISLPAAPTGSREVVGAALDERLSRHWLNGFSGSLRLAGGIPRLTLPAARHPRLTHARIVAWDFLVVSEQAVGLASARIDDGVAVFAGILRGPFAERVLAASAAAARALGEAPAVYRPFFLESGPAGAFAMVLKPDRGTGYYVDVLDGRLPEGGKVELRRGLGALLDRIGARSVRRFDYGLPK